VASKSESGERCAQSRLGRQHVEAAVALMSACLGLTVFFQERRQAALGRKLSMRDVVVMSQPEDDLRAAFPFRKIFD